MDEACAYASSYAHWDHLCWMERSNLGPNGVMSLTRCTMCCVARRGVVASVTPYRLWGADKGPYVTTEDFYPIASPPPNYKVISSKLTLRV